MAYRLLWMARMPGVTEEFLMEAGEHIGVAMNNQFSSIGEGELAEVQEYCRLKLNLRPDWSDALYFDTIRPLLPLWRARRDASLEFKRQKTRDEPHKKPGKKKQITQDDGGQERLF